MSTLVIAEPVTATVLSAEPRVRANLATRTILDGEISTLKARLQHRSASAATCCALVRDDLTRQIAWMQDSLTRLQTRRDALC